MYLKLPGFIFFLITLTAQSQNKIFTAAFDDNWKFNAGDDKAWAQPAFNDANWTRVRSTKSLEEQGFSEFAGFGWYRRQIIIPDSLKDGVKKGGGIVINFHGADDCDEFYFNGKMIGRTGRFPPDYRSAYDTPREYLVPLEDLSIGRPNTIAVRLYDGGGDGGLITQNLYVRNIIPFDKVVIKAISKDEDKIFF